MPITPLASDASGISDSDFQLDDDVVTEEQAEAWMREYRTLAKAKPLSKEDIKRLGELHSDLMNYRFTDPGRFEEKFQLSNGIDPELVEGAPPDNLNTNEDREGPLQKSSNHVGQKGKERYQEISQTPDRRSTKPTDIIGRRVRFQDKAEPVSVPVAWYSSNWKKNYQRRIYQIDSSDHYKIGKAKKWGLSEIANLPEVSSSKETILDIPINEQQSGSSPIQFQ